MDEKHFDNLVKDLAAPGPRRALFRFLVTLPLLGGLNALLADGADARRRRRRRKARHRRRTGDHKNNRNGGAKNQKQCAKTGQTPQKGRRKQCCQGLVPDSTGRCAAPSPPPPPPSAPCGNVCTGSEICVGETCCLPASVDLQTAIAAADPGATLTLCAGTWTLTSTLDIPKNLSLIGAGAGQTILDGGDAVRVLQIIADVTVTIEDLTITKGFANGVGGLSNGGGVDIDGGTVTMSGVAITGNHAAFTGGGIRLDSGTLTLIGVAVTDNTADFLGGGIYVVSGSLTMQEGSGITGNTAAAAGGGIRTEGGPVTMAADTIVCGNSEPQCLGTITGSCPNPADGICPA